MSNGRRELKELHAVDPDEEFPLRDSSRREGRKLSIATDPATLREASYARVAAAAAEPVTPAPAPASKFYRGWVQPAGWLAKAAYSRTLGAIGASKTRADDNSGAAAPKKDLQTTKKLNQDCKFVLPTRTAECPICFAMERDVIHVPPMVPVFLEGNSYDAEAVDRAAELTLQDLMKTLMRNEVENDVAFRAHLRELLRWWAGPNDTSKEVRGAQPASRTAQEEGVPTPEDRALAELQVLAEAPDFLAARAGIEAKQGRDSAAAASARSVETGKSSINVVLTERKRNKAAPLWRPAAFWKLSKYSPLDPVRRHLLDFLVQRLVDAALEAYERNMAAVAAGPVWEHVPEEPHVAPPHVAEEPRPDENSEAERIPADAATQREILADFRDDVRARLTSVLNRRRRDLLVSREDRRNQAACFAWHFQDDQVPHVIGCRDCLQKLLEASNPQQDTAEPQTGGQQREGGTQAAAATTHGGNIESTTPACSTACNTRNSVQLNALRCPMCRAFLSRGDLLLPSTDGTENGEIRVEHTDADGGSRKRLNAPASPRFRKFTEAELHKVEEQVERRNRSTRAAESNGDDEVLPVPDRVWVGSREAECEGGCTIL